MAPSAAPSNYIAGWLGRYPSLNRPTAENAPKREAEDRWLDGFAGRPCLDREELTALIDWNLADEFPGRHARALDMINGDRWEPVAELIAEALATDEDHEALWLLTIPGGGLYGLGPSLGSLVLAACRPERFVLFDARALASLRALGCLPKGPKSPQMSEWCAYLSVIRSTAVRTNQALRDVHRALWTAAGARKGETKPGPAYKPLRRRPSSRRPQPAAGRGE